MSRFRVTGAQDWHIKSPLDSQANGILRLDVAYFNKFVSYIMISTANKTCHICQEFISRFIRGGRGPYWPYKQTKVLIVIFERHVAIALLIHDGPTMTYGDIDLSRDWLRQWLVAWRPQAIAWANVDPPMKFCVILLRAIHSEWSNHFSV